MAEKLSQAEIDKEKKEVEKSDAAEQDGSRPKSRSPDRRRKLMKKPQERVWDWPKKSFFELSCFDSAEGGTTKMVADMLNWMFPPVWRDKWKYVINSAHYDQCTSHLISMKNMWNRAIFKYFSVILVECPVLWWAYNERMIKCQFCIFSEKFGSSDCLHWKVERGCWR